MNHDGLCRRSFLHGTGIAGLVTLAGCTSTSNLTENSEESADDASDDDSAEESTTVDDVETPEGTVRAFFEAFDSGDADLINSFIHAEAPLGEISQEEATESQETGLVVQSVQNTSVDGENATVEVRVSSDDIEGSGEGPRPFVVELRQQDGEWQVWNVRPPGEEGADTSVPQAAFDVESEGSTLEIAHNGGDPIPPSELYVRGEGLARTGSWAELGGGTTADSDETPVVSAGNRLSVESDEEYTVRLVWESDGESAVLYEMSGTRETASDSNEVEDNLDEAVEAQQYLDDANGFDGSILDLTGEPVAVVKVGGPQDSDWTFAFASPAIRVDPGTTVRWEWNNGSAHSVTAVDGTFDSGVRDGTDEMFRRTFDDPGASLYYCKPHRERGMKGAVIVADS